MKQNIRVLRRIDLATFNWSFSKEFNERYFDTERIPEKKNGEKETTSPRQKIKIRSNT